MRKRTRAMKEADAVAALFALSDAVRFDTGPMLGNNVIVFIRASYEGVLAAGLGRAGALHIVRVLDTHGRFEDRDEFGEELRYTFRRGGTSGQRAAAALTIEHDIANWLRSQKRREVRELPW